MIDKLGIVCNNLGPSQLPYYLIQSGNKFVESGNKDVVIFFYELIHMCKEPLFAVMNLAEAYNYNGPLIATDLNSASRILEFPGATKKILYCWDLEYLRLPNRQYEELYSVYGKMPLIVRSTYHKYIMETIWGGNVIGICPDANIEEMWKMI